MWKQKMLSKRFSTVCSRITFFTLLAAAAVSAPGPAAGTRPEERVALLRFNSYSLTVEAMKALNAQIKTAAGKKRLFIIPPAATESLWYEYEPGITLSGTNLARYEALCAQIQCPHLMIGTAYRRQNDLFIQAKIYSSQEKRIICTLDQAIEGGDLAKAAAQLVKRTSLFFEGKLPVVSNLAVSRGKSKDAVELTWKSNTSGNTYTIYRSPYQNGTYEEIGKTGSVRFTDSTAETGIKYWYRVTVMTDDLPGISASGFGYRNPPNPKGLTLSGLLDGHTRPWPEPATEEEKELEKKNLKLYEKYYESYFMVTFIIMVGRMYIKSGELLAFRGFKFHHFDQPNRIVYFSKPGMPLVKFRSRRFFRFFRDVQLMELDFYAILKRIVDNGVMFCIRTGEQEMMEPDGRTRYVPTLEVVGMMTEYHRDYEKWKSNVIVFASSDEEIYRKIREAQVKGY
mgnify:FL=1